jgi:Uri superfamily endonuclease
MKGSYVLLIELNQDINVKIGSLGNIFFKKGFYCYVGSAFNSLEQRIQRHVRKDKKIHWHIDYFLNYGKIIDIFYKLSKTKNECNIAQKFNSKIQNILNFGCSDCKCESHLFYGDKSKILESISKINMIKYPFNANT